MGGGSAYYMTATIPHILGIIEGELSVIEVEPNEVRMKEILGFPVALVKHSGCPIVLGDYPRYSR